jgi:hypothetical protein
MCKDHHLIRMAGRIHRQLFNRSSPVHGQWEYAVNDLLAQLKCLERHWMLTRLASVKGWHAAAAHHEEQVQLEAVRVEQAASRLANEPLCLLNKSDPPTLRTIVEELEQLKDEFEDVEIDLKEGLIGVTTEPIVLEDINLGPFSIELHVSRLSERQDSQCFRCIALEPNPAASRDDTTHPHVQDGHLCAGDATQPVAAALKEGRIADAFVLIRSVLQTYNSDSPYIALENWSGHRCEDCDYLSDSDGLYHCDSCDRDVCEECYSRCDMCDEGCCRSCLETDNVSGNRCCSTCRHTCGECLRTVDSESFDQETELCPGCLEKQQTNQEQETEHESESKSQKPATTATTTPAVPAAA